MSDENIQEGESQEQKSGEENGASNGDANGEVNGKEDEKNDGQEVSSAMATEDDQAEAEELEPEEEDVEPQETAASIPTEPLRDPRTGALLRDQNPGVPNSPWVNKHKSSDVDNQVAKEPAIAESDFGKD